MRIGALNRKAVNVKIGQMKLVQSNSNSRKSLPRNVRVSAPSRIHFGLYSPKGETARQFGGIGLMVDAPRLEVSIVPSSRFSLHGDLYSRSLEFVRLWSKSRQQDCSDNAVMPPPCRIEVSAPPNHVGLGVGTQLALALGSALDKYFGHAKSINHTALEMGRGQRSAVGIHGFQSGGLVFDNGKIESQNVGDLGKRLDFPEDWKILLIVPTDQRFVFGENEAKAFKQISQAESAHQSLEHDSLMSSASASAIQNSVMKNDFRSFSENLFDYGYNSGLKFQSVQGGGFNGPIVTKIVNGIRSLGIKGVGQSSWGPLIYAFLPCLDEAKNLQKEIASRFTIQNTWIATADNRGAIRTETGGRKMGTASTDLLKPSM